MPRPLSEIIDPSWARALAPVEQAIGSWKGFIDFRASYRRLDEILRKNPESGGLLQLPPPVGLVQVEKLVVVRDQIQILKGLTFAVTAGEVVGIIGPSGAGKSTLLRALAGVWQPTAGNVRLDGADLAVWPRDRKSVV